MPQDHNLILSKITLKYLDNLLKLLQLNKLKLLQLNKLKLPLLNKLKLLLQVKMLLLDPTLKLLKILQDSQFSLKVQNQPFADF